MENSSFDKLSAELRNQIWELVLVHDKSLRVQERHRNYDANADEADYFTHDSEIRCELAHENKPNLLALTITCRQIHSEATPIFYALNTFVMVPGYYWSAYPARHYPTWMANTTSQFCADIGPTNTLALRSMQLFLEPTAFTWCKESTRRTICKQIIQTVAIENVYSPDCDIRVVGGIDGFAPSSITIDFNLRNFEPEWKSFIQEIVARCEQEGGSTFWSILSEESGL